VVADDQVAGFDIVVVRDGSTRLLAILTVSATGHIKDVDAVIAPTDQAELDHIIHNQFCTVCAELDSYRIKIISKSQLPGASTVPQPTAPAPVHCVRIKTPVTSQRRWGLLYH
jgi:hypothetical protein